LTAPARSTATGGAWRHAKACALAFATLAVPCAAHAQFASTLGIDSVDRYRGTGTDDLGPVLRASAMADATSGFASGAYAGVAGLWRTRDGGLASADAIVGWSGRLNTFPGLAALAPDWGWDAGVHRMHQGEGSRYDFSEAMVGLLAPGWSLRTWFAPHYFGGDMPAFYTEFNASHAFDEHWHAFGHAGRLHYGPAGAYESRPPDRTDALAGIGYAFSTCDIRVSHDGLLAGSARGDIESRQRRPAWILGASVAF